jgi:hypothetical protein
MRAHVVAGLAGLLALPSIAGGKKVSAAEDTVDISTVKDRLIVLHDGKGHFVVTVPFASGDDTDFTFWSADGKVFHRQRIQGSGASGTESWDQTFWDPRYPAGYKRGIGYRENKYTVQCDERKTELTRMSDTDARKLIGGAKFLKARFRRWPYALARDDRGTYYYVDRDMLPENNKNFRLFVGQKGNLKLTKLVNVVSDSEGDIFSTKKGELRLVLSRKDAEWIKGKDKTQLTNVPPDDNLPMIFTELGVYAGEPLGTPCDDL